MTTPEGTLIEVDTKGPFTAQQIYEMLKASGLDATIGRNLTVKVQDIYPSQVSTSVNTAGGTYSDFRASMYLQGWGSSFAAAPTAGVAHELGHVWSLYHYYITQQGKWDAYLQARGLAGDPRLDSNYTWSIREIIAEDYRMLLGPQAALHERPQHMNPYIADPRAVPGLREFFLTRWAA